MKKGEIDIADDLLLDIESSPDPDEVTFEYDSDTDELTVDAEETDSTR